MSSSAALLLLIGLFTRPVAFVLSGLLAFAYFIGHASRGEVLSPMLNGGEAAVLFCFICLFMAVAGGGSWSLDARRAPPRYRGLHRGAALRRGSTAVPCS